MSDRASPLMEKILSPNAPFLHPLIFVFSLFPSPRMGSFNFPPPLWWSLQKGRERERGLLPLRYQSTKLRREKKRRMSDVVPFVFVGCFSPSERPTTNIPCMALGHFGLLKEDFFCPIWQKMAFLQRRDPFR